MFSLLCETGLSQVQYKNRFIIENGIQEVLYIIDQYIDYIRGGDRGRDRKKIEIYIYLFRERETERQKKIVRERELESEGRIYREKKDRLR